MKEITFVIGGCRSGKSGHALDVAEQISRTNRYFFATCIPHDDEMKQRVDTHKKERDPSWQALETPIQLPEAIIENSQKSDVILVDCLTLWISNLLMETTDLTKISEKVQTLVASLENAQCPIVLVSNEVGTGIVPENKLARLFRDAAGFANQKVAQCADKVIWMVAGIPVPIKG